MVHEIFLLKLKTGITPDQVETIMVETRIRLLKIPEVMNLKCGKKIDLRNNPHDVFVCVDFENLTKARIARDSAIFTQYEKQVLEPNVEKVVFLDYEMDPGKDVAYS